MSSGENPDDLASDEAVDRFTRLPHPTTARFEAWLRRRFGTRAPDRLADPQGEGVYMRSPNLLLAANELLPDWRDWRTLNYKNVWMREGEDGTWHRSRWRGRDAFKLPRWQPQPYAYITPPSKVRA